MNNYTGTYRHDPTTFGGLIYESDFNTDFRGKDEKSSPIASRIMADMKFDKQCRLLAQSRERNKNNVKIKTSVERYRKKRGENKWQNLNMKNITTQIM